MCQKLIKVLLFIGIFLTLVLCPIVIIYGVSAIVAGGACLLVLAPALLMTWIVYKLVCRLLFGKVNK